MLSQRLWSIIYLNVEQLVHANTPLQGANLVRKSVDKSAP